MAFYFCWSFLLPLSGPIYLLFLSFTFMPFPIFTHVYIYISLRFKLRNPNRLVLFQDESTGYSHFCTEIPWCPFMVYILSPLDFCAEGERKFLLLKRMIEILHFISLTIFDEVFLILFSLLFVCVLLAGLSLLWGILCKSLSLSLTHTHTHTHTQVLLLVREHDMGYHTFS